MKKGFTLIELLAVIVVLAIIALIALPIITGVVNKARLNSLKTSAYGLVDASTLYQAQYGMGNYRFDIKNNKVTSLDTTNMIKYKGTIKEGTIIINHNKITICITDGKNSAYKNYNESKVTLVSKKTCSVPTNTNIVYLDNEATLTELSNQELTNEIALLKEEIANLKSGKADKTQLSNDIDSLATKNELQQVNTTLSGNMSSINNSLIERINQLNDLLATKSDKLYVEAAKMYSSVAITGTIYTTTTDGIVQVTNDGVYIGSAVGGVHRAVITAGSGQYSSCFVRKGMTLQRVSTSGTATFFPLTY